MNEEIVYKDFNHGDLKVRSVPYNQYSRGYGANGDTEYIDGAVLYRISKILKSMLIEGSVDAIYSDTGSYKNVSECDACCGIGFDGRGTGYDSMCDNCGGLGATVRYSRERLN